MIQYPKSTKRTASKIQNIETAIALFSFPKTLDKGAIKTIANNTSKIERKNMAAHKKPRCFFDSLLSINLFNPAGSSCNKS